MYEIHYKRLLQIPLDHILVKHPIYDTEMCELCYSKLKLKLKWHRASQWTPSPVGHLLVRSAVEFVSTHYGVHLNIIETP